MEEEEENDVEDICAFSVLGYRAAMKSIFIAKCCL